MAWLSFLLTNFWKLAIVLKVLFKFISLRDPINIKRFFSWFPEKRALFLVNSKSIFVLRKRRPDHLQEKKAVWSLKVNLALTQKLERANVRLFLTFRYWFPKNMRIFHAERSYFKEQSCFQDIFCLARMLFMICLCSCLTKVIRFFNFSHNF